MIQSHKTQPWISSEKALTYFFYWNQGFPVHQGLVGWSWFSIGRSRKHTSVYTFIVLFFGAWECEWAWYSPDSIWICFHDMSHIPWYMSHIEWRIPWNVGKWYQWFQRVRLWRQQVFEFFFCWRVGSNDVSKLNKCLFPVNITSFPVNFRCLLYSGKTKYSDNNTPIIRLWTIDLKIS